MRSGSRTSAPPLLLLAALAPLLAGCAAAPPPAPPAAAAPAPPPGNVFLLLREPSGRVGVLAVANEGGSVTLDAEAEATAVRDAHSAPGPPRVLDPAEIRALFGPALDAAPSPPVHFSLSFAQGSAELAETARAQVPRIVAAIRERASVDTSVVGHTDTLGEKAANHALSLERAGAVAALLVAAGVDPATLEVASHGEENPLVPTADGVAEPRNRRVEVTVR